MIIFLKKITYFGIIIIISVIVLEITIRQIPNDFSVKQNGLDKFSNEIEILNLGSSIELNAINPSLFHRKAFNAAMSAQPLEMDYFLFNKYLSQLNSLKILILPLSYFSIDYRIPQNNIWIFEYHDKFGIKPDYFIWKNNYVLTTYHCKTIFRILYQFVTKQIDKRIQLDSLGWRCEQGSFSDLSSSEKKLNVKAYADDNIQKCEINNRLYNISLLNNMIEECSKRNIDVILLSAPMTEMYIDYVDNSQIQYIINLGNKLADQKSNVTYINCFYTQTFTENDFVNANHLNPQGASKMTCYLDSIIENQILN